MRASYGKPVASNETKRGSRDNRGGTEVTPRRDILTGAESECLSGIIDGSSR